jgi:site-specific DNA recombinase
VSNPENCVDVALHYALNLPSIWEQANYKEKSALQKLLFPEGIYYDKKTDRCRTTRINSVFLQSALPAQDLSNKKTGIPALNVSYSGLVAPAGIEPTSKV